MPSYQNHLDILLNLLTDANTLKIAEFFTNIQKDDTLNLKKKFLLVSQASIVTLANQSKKLLKQYLLLITEIFTHSESTFSSEQIYTLLSARTTDGWNLGNLIAHHYPILLEHYLSLLIILKEKGFSIDHIHALAKIESIIKYEKARHSAGGGTYTTIEIESHTFLSYLFNLLSLPRIPSYDIDAETFTTTLLDLLNHNLLSPKEYKKKSLFASNILLNQKDLICQYILGLPNRKKITGKYFKLLVLGNALNPQHSLGKYFAEPYFLTTNYDSGTLEKLKEAFLSLVKLDDPYELYKFLFIQNEDFTDIYKIPYTVLLHHKQPIYNYLVNDENWPEEKSVERITAIKSALNPSESLGKLIWCKRLVGVPTKTNGTRALLIQKLLTLEPDANLSFIPEAISDVIAPDIENHKSESFIETLNNNWKTIDSKNQEAIDSFINTFVSAENSQKNIRQLINALGQIDSDGHTSWHKIAETEQTTAHQQNLNFLYLKILLAALESNTKYSYKILTLLNIRTPMGWSIGNIIACKQLPSAINLYLDVLLGLQKAKIPNYFLSALQCNQTTLPTESFTSANPTTFVTHLATRTEKNIPNIIIRFLYNNFLIFKLKNRTILVNDALLATKDRIKDCIMQFSHNQNRLIDILQDVFTSHTALNIFFLTKRGMMSPNYQSGTLKPLTEKFISIMNFDNPKTLYQLLTSRKFPYPYEILANQKEALFIYMLSLPTTERTTALQKAQDQNHPLGKVFWLKRGNVEPDLNCGTLKELNYAEQNSHIWTDSTKMLEVLKEINLPFQATSNLPAPALMSSFFASSPFETLQVHRKNLRNYIFSLTDIRQKLILLRNSLNSLTPLGKFFQDDIISANPYQSPRLNLLLQAFQYFASLPEAEKHQDIQLTGPYFSSASDSDKNHIELKTVRYLRN